MKRIHTGISEIEKRASSGAFFISGWDKSSRIMNVSHKIIDQAIQNKSGLNRYYFMSNLSEFKSKFCNDVFYGKDVCADNIFIAPNGTVGIFLSILAIKDLYNASNVLLVSPTYFTDINVIQRLEMNLFHFQLNPFKDFEDYFNKVVSCITRNNIDLIIITDPLFGTGVLVGESIYREFFEIAKQHNIWLIIDYVYGGMEWESTASIANKNLIKLVLEAPKAILIESISKRLFLNGIKNAIAYTNPQLTKVIEEMSESFIGSFSCTQYEMVKEIYNPKNLIEVLDQISKNILHVKDTFEILKSTLLGSELLLSPVNSGYYALMALPTERIGGLKDFEAARAIADQTNILTIPHSRYLFELDDYYCFRVNLSMDRSSILKHVNRLLDTYVN